MQEFEDRVVLVTGAAQGLGFAISSLFVERGATVCMLDVGAGRLESAAGSLGPRAIVGETIIASGGQRML